MCWRFISWPTDWLKQPAEQLPVPEKMPGYFDDETNQEKNNNVPATGRTIQRGFRGYDSLLTSLGHRQIFNNYVVQNVNHNPPPPCKWKKIKTQAGAELGQAKLS